MSCETIQNRILALPDPRQVPDALRDHLTGCPACQAWWRQAVRLERLVEQLPVPPAPGGKKTALIGDLTAPEPIITSIPTLDRRPGRSAFRQLWSLPGAKAVAGLAASVLVVVGGWAMFRPGPAGPMAQRPAPRHPLLETMVQRHRALAQAKTPDQRLDVLGSLADDLSAETRSLARVASAEELRDLSAWFNKVVDDGIVTQAEKVAGTQALTPDQKAALFGRLSAKLARAGQEADDASGTAPPHARPVLKTISDKARDGQTKLQALTRPGA